MFLIFIFGAIGLSLYLLNNNFNLITGSAIKSLNSSSNFIGLILISILILVGYFYFKRLK